MTDRELLELAAKAAYGDFGSQMVSGGWNPLTNDGDALCLAVLLSMRITTNKNGCAVRYGDDYENLIAVGLDEAEDCYLATRIAITMAAAEIGESMNA